MVSCNAPHHCPPPVHNPSTTNPSALSFPSYTPFNLHRPFRSKIKSWSGVCHASGPQPETPQKKYRPSPSGMVESFTKFQDKLQIFLAVFFWMSLFFWSSAWDGGNNGGNKKGPRFRK